VRKVGLIVAAVAVVLGVFWAGRESTHGLGAFGDHWWCPIPLAMIAVGTAAVILVRRGSTAT
jgi:hypothetical protein